MTDLVECPLCEGYSWINFMCKICGNTNRCPRADAAAFMVQYPEGNTYEVINAAYARGVIVEKVKRSG